MGARTGLCEQHFPPRYGGKAKKSGIEKQHEVFRGSWEDYLKLGKNRIGKGEGEQGPRLGEK